MTKLTRSTAQQIVERISMSLGLAVSVADTASIVLASTDNARLGHQVALRQRAVGESLPSAAADAQADELCFPLMYANTAIGSVVLHQDRSQSVQLAPVAKALAELILHHATLLEQVMHQHWVRDRFMFNVLHGNFNTEPVEVQHEAARLDIDLAMPRIVTIIDVPPADEPTVMQIYPTHLVERARRVIAGHNQDIYSWFGPRWLVVLAVVDPSRIETERQRLVAVLQAVLDALTPELPAPPSAGLGRYYDGWTALPQSFADARFALKLGRQIYGAGQAFMPKDLGLASFVCQGDASLKSAIAHRLLQPLLEKVDLFATLEAFLRADLSPSLAAERLCIHRHTLDYRLHKIAQLTGLDPREFSAAAQLLAAMLWLGMEGVSALNTGVDAAKMLRAIHV